MRRLTCSVSWLWVYSVYVTLGLTCILLWPSTSVLYLYCFRDWLVFSFDCLQTHLLCWGVGMEGSGSCIISWPSTNILFSLLLGLTCICGCLQTSLSFFAGGQGGDVGGTGGGRGSKVYIIWQPSTIIFCLHYLQGAPVFSFDWLQTYLSCFAWGEGG